MKKFSGVRKAIDEQTLSLSEKTQHWHSFFYFYYIIHLKMSTLWTKWK